MQSKIPVFPVIFFFCPVAFIALFTGLWEYRLGLLQFAKTCDKMKKIHDFPRLFPI